MAYSLAEAVRFVTSASLESDLPDATPAALVRRFARSGDANDEGAAGGLDVVGDGVKLVDLEDALDLREEALVRNGDGGVIPGWRASAPLWGR